MRYLLIACLLLASCGPVQLISYKGFDVHSFPDYGFETHIRTIGKGTAHVRGTVEYTDSFATISRPNQIIVYRIK